MSFGARSRLVLVMALWASCFPLITIGLAFAPHLAFAALRAAIGGIALIGVAVLLRRPMPKGVDAWGMIVVLALGATSLGFLGMFHGAALLSPGLATLIFSTQPLVAALLGRIFLGERLSGQGALGLILGFVGVAVASWPALNSPNASIYLTGAGFVIAAAIGTAIGNVVMKRISQNISATIAVGWSLALGAIPLAIASAISEDTPIVWSNEFLAVLAILSLFGTALAFWLWFDALKTAPLSEANAFSFLVPLFAMTLGGLFFGERVGFPEIAGAALVVAGVALAQRRSA